MSIEPNYLGTIHKRRLLRGVGRWGPPKGDLRRRGVDTLILGKETSFFYVQKSFQMFKILTLLACSQACAPIKKNLQYQSR